MWRQLRPPRALHRVRDALRKRLASTARAGRERHAEAPARRRDVLGPGPPVHRMSPVRDYAAELDGYAYLPRMFDKARAKLAGEATRPRSAARSTTAAWRGFGCTPRTSWTWSRGMGAMTTRSSRAC